MPFSFYSWPLYDGTFGNLSKRQFILNLCTIRVWRIYLVKNLRPWIHVLAAAQRCHVYSFTDITSVSNAIAILMTVARARSAKIHIGGEKMTKAKARMRAKAKAGQKLKKREARAEQTKQVRPGQFDPGPGTIKGFDVNSNARHFGKGQRGSSRSR